MTPSTHRRRTTTAAILLVLLAGCSSSGNGTTATPPGVSTTPPNSTASPSVTASDSPSSSSAGPTHTAATFTATDDSGNAGRLVISLGTIQPANQISDSVIQACRSDITQVGASYERTLAVPLTIQLQLTSTLASTLMVNLANEYVAVTGGPPEAALNRKPFLLATSYTAGPKCAVLDSAQVRWPNAATGVAHAWHSYILQPNAITPNDPTGAAGDLHRLLVDPIVSLGAGSLTKLTYVTTDSPSEVVCLYPTGGGSGRELLAIEPSAVLNYGCSPA